MELILLRSAPNAPCRRQTPHISPPAARPPRPTVRAAGQSPLQAKLAGEREKRNKSRKKTKKSRKRVTEAGGGRRSAVRRVSHPDSCTLTPTFPPPEWQRGVRPRARRRLAGAQRPAVLCRSPACARAAAVLRRAPRWGILYPDLPTWLAGIDNPLPLRRLDLVRLPSRRPLPLVLLGLARAAVLPSRLCCAPVSWAVGCLACRWNWAEHVEPLRRRSGPSRRRAHTTALRPSSPAT